MDKIKETFQENTKFKLFLLSGDSGGWIWQTLGIETLFIASAVFGLCNSAYAASIQTKKRKSAVNNLSGTMKTAGFFAETCRFLFGGPARPKY